MTTTEDERQAIKTRFRNEGLDEQMPDDKKLPHVWRWLCDAEFNVISMKKQNEKLYKQQEADLKEVEEYIESLWKQSNGRLVDLQTENRLLKQEIYSLKLSKPTDMFLEIVNNNKKNLISKQLSGENGELSLQPNDQQQKENKKSAFSNVKQMFIKNNKDQNGNNKQQINLENELKFMIDKCRSIENEKKQLEAENENLVFKLNETLNACDKLESSVTNVQLARNSKSFYELRQATSDYRLNKPTKDKLTTSKTMNFQSTQNEDNKSTSGVDSSSSQDKENDPIKLKIDEKTSLDRQEQMNSSLIVNQQQQHLIDSGRETCSPANDSRNFKDFTNPKEPEQSRDKEMKTALHLLNAVREESAILKKELFSKEKQLIIQEKQLSELLLKYDKRKARHKEQMTKLRNNIDRETKRWQKLFDAAKQRSIESEHHANLVDSL